MFDMTEAIVAYVNAIAGMFLVIGTIIILYSLDDVFVDIAYWLTKLFGAEKTRHPDISEESLLARPQRYLAVMVPAWHEEDVIYDMLKTNVVHSPMTVFFVGAYPNDYATQKEVLKAAEEHPANIQLVVGPNPGPTTKADCLNALLMGIEEYEQETGVKFAGYVLHDSEDVIHPLESPLFNALINELDFIQIPVYSFSRSLLQAVAGTYMDEFAEFHNKDLVVRENLTGIVPCAGVAACFSRRAMDAIKQARAGEVFDATALTEDYDIAFLIKQLGLKPAFVHNPASYTMDIPEGTSELQRIDHKLAIAVREYFPSDYRAAYRQRSRWILGIGFQGASKLGWGDTLAEKIFFMRDRKGIFSGIIAVIAYFLTFNAVLIAVLARYSEDWRIAAYALLDPALKIVFVINVALLVNRLIQRMIFAAKVYGLAQGLMAGPRVIFSNFVNFSAALRALYIFIWRHKVNKEPLGWDKTAHSIPTQTEAQPVLTQ
jgi:bacteriophage N4 adsorption protein B